MDGAGTDTGTDPISAAPVAAPEVSLLPRADQALHTAAAPRTATALRAVPASDTQNADETHTAPALAANGLDDLDRARVRGVCASLRSCSLESLLGELFAGVDAGRTLIDSIARHCVLAHRALRIFPDDFDQALRVLTDLGTVPGPVVPSVIVKGRLAERYRVPADSLDVRITHAALAETTAL